MNDVHEEKREGRHPDGALIALEGQLAGVFLDGVCPEAPGEYGYAPMPTIGHQAMSVSARAGGTRCTWTRRGRPASFHVLAIPRDGVLLIDKVVVAGNADGSNPVPPWVLDPEPRVEDGGLWTMHDDPHVHRVWRPFWDLLRDEERSAYVLRHPPPGWERFLQDVGFDQEVARIDMEDIATGVLQPNGSPWPQPVVARLSLCRHLFRRR